ncbi:hypothetical protein L3Q82_024167 [Scortum barcoo]|uniref:Uncharacterized protein n=1 Tax=Scortum barcoo TaxID=214431 RepID=A0ACB8WUB8_9TELE|nr:hypothetical protein L3Q82_024167 [Scortum barcoo]
MVEIGVRILLAFLVPQHSYPFTLLSGALAPIVELLEQRSLMIPSTPSSPTTTTTTNPGFHQSSGQLCQAKEEAYRSEDRILYNQARNTLSEEIRVAKRSYTEKLKNNFSASNLVSVWMSLETITNYRRSSPHTERSHYLAEELSGTEETEDQEGTRT